MRQAPEPRWWGFRPVPQRGHLIAGECPVIDLDFSGSTGGCLGLSGGEVVFKETNDVVGGAKNCKGAAVSGRLFAAHH